MNQHTTQNTEDMLDELVGVNDDTISQIENALDNDNITWLLLFIENLHPADTADVYEKLGPNDREKFLDALGDDLNGEIIIHLDDDIRTDILASIRPKPLALLLENLETDDAVGLLEGLDEDKQKSILRYTNLSDRMVYKQALSYNEDTAARIMRHELVSAPEIWTVGHIIDMLRYGQDSLPASFNAVIVLGRGHKPLGSVPLHRILTSERKTAVKNLIDTTDFRPIPATLPQQDVAYLFKQYDMVEAPVVDDQGRVIGVITIDDIVDIIDEQAEDDILKLGGLIAGDFYKTVAHTTKSRFPWLLINLATAILASFVIGLYTDVLQQVVILAVLMPIVASMGGNAGTQTLTVAVRALATNDLSSANALRIIWKESLVGGINGILFAVLIGVGVWLYMGDIQVGQIMAISMILNLLVAGFAGILVPIVLAKFNADPAVSSTVFLTTITDVVGFFIFLGTASIILL